MSQELHYTSVPRGLKPGTRGFCTVAMTPQVPGPLLERLENLSGYQPVYPPHDPASARNPIHFAHVRMSLAGRPVSVLSRVGPAGLDYSGRTNKYAHHVVIDADERPEGGPAWLLGRPGFMQAAWDGEPRMIDEGRPVPRGDRPGGIATAWAAAIGDAGWAGALAEAFLTDPKRPAFLVFRPGMDLLPLFAEAIALLPPSRRWDVEFSTYLTQAPRGITYAWRGVLEGSPEAANARRLPNALVIDLCGAPGRAEGGPLVHTARTGEHREWTTMPAAPPSTAPAREIAASAVRPIPHAGAAPREQMVVTSTNYDLIPELAARLAPKRSSNIEGAGPTAHRSRKTQVLVAGVLAACLVGVAGIGASTYFTWSAITERGRGRVAGVEVIGEAGTQRADTRAQRPTVAGAESGQASLTDRKPAEEARPERPAVGRPAEPKQTADNEMSSQAAPSAEEVLSKAPPKKAPLGEESKAKITAGEDVKASGKDAGAAPAQSPPPEVTKDSSAPLRPIFIELKDPSVSGEIKSHHFIIAANIHAKELALTGVKSDLECRRDNDGIRVLFAGAAGQGATLARFHVSDGRVIFQWDETARGKLHQARRDDLRKCILHIKDTSDHAHYCMLIKKPVKTGDPIKITSARKPGRKGQSDPLSFIEGGSNRKTWPYTLVGWADPDQLKASIPGQPFIDECMVQFPGSSKPQALTPAGDEKRNWCFKERDKEFIRLHCATESNYNNIRFEYKINPIVLYHNIKLFAKQRDELGTQIAQVNPDHPSRMKWLEDKERLERRIEELHGDMDVIKNLINSEYSVRIITSVDGKLFEVARLGVFANTSQVTSRTGRN